MARYRLRTELRGSLPWALARMVPKGRRDCGAHEWHRADEHTDRCYHCSVAERPHVDGESTSTSRSDTQAARQAHHA